MEKYKIQINWRVRLTISKSSQHQPGTSAIPLPLQCNKIKFRKMFSPLTSSYSYTGVSVPRYSILQNVYLEKKIICIVSSAFLDTNHVQYESCVVLFVLVHKHTGKKSKKKLYVNTGIPKSKYKKISPTHTSQS